jgi:pimeloyl-ACP methyl ester carboxylesterase
LAGPRRGIPFAEVWVGLLGDLLDDRDLVVMDYRGFGSSSPLRCPSVNGNLATVSAEEVAACAQELGPRHDAFHSANAARDLAAVLDALGVETVSLIGESYGTLFAQAFAARFPERVSTMVLDSSIGRDGFRDIGWVSFMNRYHGEACAATTRLHAE